MRLACIDIGSNTTRLLLAERTAAGLQVVMQERLFTRLGAATGADGRIGAAKLAEVAAEVAAQVRTARSLGAERTVVVATAAVRRAANGAELCAAVEAACGLPVRLLSGEQEARLAFAGATRGLALGEPGEEAVGVVDVGGGSCELVVGTPRAGVTWWKSLTIGSGTLADAHLHGDPPLAAELEAARAAVATALAALDPPAVTLALAVGGSATSLYRLTGGVLDGATLERALAALVAEPSAAVAERWTLDPRRVRLLPAGILILGAAGALLRAPLRVAAGGLREGVLLAESG